MTESTIGQGASTTALEPGVRWVQMHRDLEAPPARVYRAWADPEELARWFPRQVEGGLAVGARTTLAWPAQRTWWEVVAAEPNRRFVFRWPWLPDDSYLTQVTVTIEPRGYGSRLSLQDGPFDVTDARILDAYADACGGWGEALVMLRAHLDFSVDVRDRR